MARLLRLLPDPAGTHEPGSVDPPKITFISLAAVGERAQPLHRTAPSWRISVQSSGCRRFADGVLAHVRTSGGPSGPAQPSLRFTRSAPTLRSVSGLTRSNRRGTWPVCPVVWEGRRREVPPYPDHGSKAATRSYGGECLLQWPGRRKPSSLLHGQPKPSANRLLLSRRKGSKPPA